MKKKEMQMEEGGKNVVMETFGNYDTWTRRFGYQIIPIENGIASQLICK